MTTTYKIAHIQEQGQDMIIIPLDSTFENKTGSDQREIIASLQAYALSAGLAGTVVVAWRTGSSHKFISPDKWQPFFKTLPWNVIVGSLNKTLTCS